MISPYEAKALGYRLAIISNMNIEHNVHFRPYEDSDWPDLCEVHDLARLDELKSSVSSEAFLDLEATYESEGLFDGEVWVAHVNTQVVGFVAVAEDEVNWLYVHPAYYRKGIGRKLLQLILQRCGPIVETTALEGNGAAIQLYLSEGFEVVERRVGKLAGNEAFDAVGLIMKRDAAKIPIQTGSFSTQ